MHLNRRLKNPVYKPSDADIRTMVNSSAVPLPLSWVVHCHMKFCSAINSASNTIHLRNELLRWADFRLKVYKLTLQTQTADPAAATSCIEQHPGVAALCSNTVQLLRSENCPILTQFTTAYSLPMIAAYLESGKVNAALSDSVRSSTV